MNGIDTLIASAISLIAGGGLVSYLKFRAESNKDGRSVLKEELELYKVRYHELRQELDALSTLLIPSAAPEWRKNYRGEYEYISPSYEVTILLRRYKTKEDVIGKTDAEIFKSYPDFVSLLTSIDEEAKNSNRRYAVRFNVLFPGNHDQMMIIKEVAQNIAGRNYFIGRCYPYTHESTKENDKGKQTQR